MKTSTSLFSLAGTAAVLLFLVACSGSGQKNANDSLAADSMGDPAMLMDTAMTDTTSYDAAHVDISGTKADTTVNGTAHFTRKDGKVSMTLTLTIPKKANSTVAVHFHEHGDCSDMGEGAHGHWNPTGEKHGKWGSGEYHSGDIGNIQLDKNGKATFTLESDRWTIGGPAKTNILNHAVIVHSGVDDYTSQPSGNAGSRIGCGVIMHL